jgi:hypothetical protein
VVKVPPGQAVQERSAVSVPAVETKLPGAHCVHAEQALAFSALLKVPLGQPAQMRSCVGVPSLETNCPAAQRVQSTHAPLPSVAANEPCAQTLPPSLPPLLVQPTFHSALKSSAPSASRWRVDRRSEGRMVLAFVVLNSPPTTRPGCKVVREAAPLFRQRRIESEDKLYAY